VNLYISVGKFRSLAKLFHVWSVASVLGLNEVLAVKAVLAAPWVVTLVACLRLLDDAERKLRHVVSSFLSLELCAPEDS